MSFDFFIFALLNALLPPSCVCSQGCFKTNGGLCLGIAPAQRLAKGDVKITKIQMLGPEGGARNVAKVLTRMTTLSKYKPICVKVPKSYHGDFA